MPPRPGAPPPAVAGARVPLKQNAGGRGARVAGAAPAAGVPALVAIGGSSQVAHLAELVVVLATLGHQRPAARRREPRAAPRAGR